MLVIEQSERGWAVSFKGLPLLTRISKAEAMEAANEHAHDRYELTGQPIGIFVRMECGDEVLVGQHG